MNIFSTIVKENEGWNGVAVYDKDISYTYPQLLSDVEWIAKNLLDSGIKPLDRCIFIADDSYEYIVYSLAILKINAAIIPLSTRAVKTELKKIIQNFLSIFFCRKTARVFRRQNCLMEKFRHLFAFPPEQQEKIRA